MCGVPWGVRARALHVDDTIDITCARNKLQLAIGCCITLPLDPKTEEAMKEKGKGPLRSDVRKRKDLGNERV